MELTKERTGFVFDVQGFSVHDGPGCRTLIFFNGCTLNCSWCSNPEGIPVKPPLMYYYSRCIGCGNCAESCPHKAIRLTDGKPGIDRLICSSCETKNCIETCYTDALQSGGHEITVSMLMKQIRRDRQFWGRDGGITLTGGEPLLQIDFAAAILSACHEACIHTAIETCGNIPWKNFQRIIPFTDWIFFDLKHFNKTEHKKAINASNALILENARRLAREFPGRLIFRMPLVPGFNDSPENLNSIISFLRETGKNEINILPLHHLGREKYRLLGKSYSAESNPVPSPELLMELEKKLLDEGIKCYSGSETPY